MSETENRIVAQPTKDLFISMLVKDIELSKAIADLVDNSVDGAQRLRGDGILEGLYVDMHVSGQNFTIRDNCGGIEVDLARRYAFRFGRPPDMPITKHSVGQFGVGMKRALFKLGRRFEIDATAKNSQFHLVIDVDLWRNHDRWEFEFDDLKENLAEIPEEQRGTTIKVAPLHEQVSEEFSLDFFLSRLSQELSDAHVETLSRGLTIKLNNQELKHRPIQFKQSDELQPAYVEKNYHLKDRDNVAVRIYTGISESDPSLAGWYVFCNGRLVLKADRTSVTGWDYGRLIPRYHNQFARFRGYAFFDSQDASLLPWNTTKNGVDVDSGIYRAAKVEMVNLMRPVITFLNHLDDEHDRVQATDQRVMEKAVDAAPLVTISDLTASALFVAPHPNVEVRPPKTGRIQYSKPLDEIDKVRTALKVSTLRDVGEKTFEYFLRLECET